NNKQGSGEPVPFDDAMAIIREFEEDQKALYSRYEKLLDKEIARELARINLPLSLYTEWYWQIDLHNLFHFIALRADAHAQKQIRVYAEALAQCAKAVAPLAYEAFEENALQGAHFSRAEFEAMKAMLRGEPCP